MNSFLLPSIYSSSFVRINYELLQYNYYYVPNEIKDGYTFSWTWLLIFLNISLMFLRLFLVTFHRKFKNIENLFGPLNVFEVMGVLGDTVECGCIWGRYCSVFPNSCVRLIMLT